MKNWKTERNKQAKIRGQQIRTHRNATEVEAVYLDGVKYARITPIRHPNQFVDIEWRNALEWLENYDMFTGDDLSVFNI